MKKFTKFIRRAAGNFWVRLIFILLCVIAVFAIGGVFKPSSDSVFEKVIDIITSPDTVSVLLAAMLSLILVDASFRVKRALEESMKIEDDHHKIVCKYDKHRSDDPHVYDKAPSENFCDKRGKTMYLTRVPDKRKRADNTETDKYSDAYAAREKDISEYIDNGRLYLPSVCVYANISGKTQVVFADTDDDFKLPSFVKENMLKLMEAHKTSKISNSVTIRLKDFEYNGDTLVLKTERTKYFDMLMTNRCMDYRPDGLISVRDVFESDKRVTPLKKSELGNQIGINGLIITRDGYLLLEKRGYKKAIWKNKFAQPISLAMKRNDTGLADGEIFDGTPETANAVFKKIVLRTVKDNFGLTENDIYKFDMSSNFMGIARDLLEGGKPNMYFYVLVDKTRDELAQYLQDKAKRASELPYAAKQKAKAKAKANETDKNDDPIDDALPKVTADKLGSDYYLIHHSDIKIDYDYALKVKARKIVRVKRRYYPRVSKRKQRADGRGYRMRRAFDKSLKRECGEALLACLFFSDACSARIAREQAELTAARQKEKV